MSGDGIQRGPRVQEQVGEAVRPLLVAAARPARRQLFLPRLRLLLFRAAAGRRGPVAQLPDPGGRHQGPAAGAGFSKVHPRRLLRLGTSSVDPPSPPPPPPTTSGIAVSRFSRRFSFSTFTTGTKGEEWNVIGSCSTRWLLLKPFEWLVTISRWGLFLRFFCH